MEYFAGLDVSLEETAICVVDGEDRVAGEARVASEPSAIAEWFEARGCVLRG